MGTTRDFGYHAPHFDVLPFHSIQVQNNDLVPLTDKPHTNKPKNVTHKKKFILLIGDGTANTLRIVKSCV